MGDAARMVKIHLINLDSPEDKEVSVEEAQKIVQEAWAEGMAVVDRQTGTVVDRVTEDTRDILIVLMIEGG